MVTPLSSVVLSSMEKHHHKYSNLTLWKAMGYSMDKFQNTHNYRETKRQTGTDREIETDTETDRKTET